MKYYFATIFVSLLAAAAITSAAPTSAGQSTEYGLTKRQEDASNTAGNQDGAFGSILESVFGNNAGSGSISVAIKGNPEPSTGYQTTPYYDPGLGPNPYYPKN